MIASQLMSHDFSRSAVEHATAPSERDAGRSDVAPPAASAPNATRFQPLDPGVLNETIPAFFIGRNNDGFWVARDAKGRIGGLFLLESSALSFAQRKSGPGGCATIFPTDRIELDLKNQGNRFATQLGWLKHIAIRTQQRSGAILDRARKALQWRPEDPHVS
jgi:hypothetical protein